VVDEPTLGEVMRRLEETSRQLAGIADRMREDRSDAAKTYVRQDVYLAQRQADHAVVSDLQSDISAVGTKLEGTEAARKANVRWAIGTGLALAAVLVALFGVLIQMGPPA
jgi:hypothetical protein